MARIIARIKSAECITVVGRPQEAPQLSALMLAPVSIFARPGPFDCAQGWLARAPVPTWLRLAIDSDSRRPRADDRRHFSLMRLPDAECNESVAFFDSPGVR